jgi:amidohydrolase
VVIINRFAEYHDEITAWRRNLHENPELSYDVQQTAAFVAKMLESFAVDEVVTGIGRTGVVGVIRGSKSGSERTVALRAELDALPIAEETGKPYASKIHGKMHACGHDGHMAMLLGAAKYLAETRNFAGRAVVVFQPAEEEGEGGKAMVDDGLMERFRIDEVYGMHMRTGLPVGNFATAPGPVMAAADEFEIALEGKGGHAARPHTCIDLIVAGSAIVQALQTIASRNTEPTKCVVVSVTQFLAGRTSNVIAERATMSGTVRTLDEGTRDLVERRLREITTTIAQAYGASAKVEYKRSCPVTINDPAAASFAAIVAQSIVGTEKVDSNVQPVMGAEDFSFMLNARPGALMFIGNGDTAAAHNPKYDFNDAAIPYGCSYWAKLVETRLTSSG